VSYLAESLKKLKYDKRMLDWNLKQKLLTKTEYEKHLSSLEDISHLKAEEKLTKDLETKEKNKPETTDVKEEIDKEDRKELSDINKFKKNLFKSEL